MARTEHGASKHTHAEFPSPTNDYGLFPFSHRIRFCWNCALHVSMYVPKIYSMSMKPRTYYNMVHVLDTAVFTVTIDTGNESSKLDQQSNVQMIWNGRNPTQTHTHTRTRPPNKQCLYPPVLPNERIVGLNDKVCCLCLFIFIPRRGASCTRALSDRVESAVSHLRTSRERTLVPALHRYPVLTRFRRRLERPFFHAG